MGEDDIISGQSLPLHDPRLIQAHWERLKLVISEDRVREAMNFSDNIRDALEESSDIRPDSPVYGEYQKMIVWAQFAQFSQLTDEEAVALVRDHYVDQFDIPEYDFVHKVNQKLYRFPLDFRDAYKARLRDALEANSQILTSNFLEVQDKKEKPIVSMWLKDYRAYAGLEPASAIKINEYLSSSVHAKALSDHDRTRLRQLINLYEKFKRSSLTFEGVEDPIIYADEKGNRYMLSEGAISRLPDPDPNDKAVAFYRAYHHISAPVVPVRASAPASVPAPDSASISAESHAADKAVQPNAPLNPVQKLKALYQDAIKKQKAIASLEAEIFGATKGRLKPLKDALYQSIVLKNTDRAIASIFLLAKSGLMHELLRGDKRFYNLLEPYLEKNFSLQIAREFKEFPHTPAFMNALLHVILRGALELDDNFAAVLGLEIGEISFANGYFEYYGMTYGNVKTGKFEWHELSMSRGGHLSVSQFQIMAIRKKLAEMDMIQKWQSIKPGAIACEDSRGDLYRLHEIGKDILNHLSSEDVDACDSHVSNDFRQKVGSEDVLKEIEEHASRIESGETKDIDKHQAEVVYDFVDLLRV